MTEDLTWYSDEIATFGDRLAGAREAAGLDQTALATKLGVKKQTMESWENDLKEPRANRLQMLAGILGVSITWLLTGEGEGPTAPEDEGHLATDVTDLLAEMRGLQREIKQSGEKLARLEKRLRKVLKDAA
ncbi:helix-turn-helix domain-containing protein [Yoonia sp.]|uniref:helix-turn-helix domain-containing protein n=1 Tax=Yoonia sp. TaxID=2212373 RepID=UPI002FD8CBEE